MNRYRPIKTDDPAIKILDTIIRFPTEMETAMTPEARAIRKKLTALFTIAGVRPSQAKVINLVKGSGWQPWPDNSEIMTRDEHKRSYTTAITKIGKYLEQTGELYEGMVVA